MSAALFHMVISSFFSPPYQFFGASVPCFSQTSCSLHKKFAAFTHSCCRFMLPARFVADSVFAAHVGLRTKR
jgi:hypothetical protein